MPLQYMGQVQAALRDDRNWRWMQQDRNMKETGTVLRDEVWNMRDESVTNGAGWVSQLLGGPFFLFAERTGLRPSQHQLLGNASFVLTSSARAGCPRKRQKARKHAHTSSLHGTL